MKVVIIEKEEGLGIGGIVMHNQRLGAFLKKSGHEVVFIRFTNQKRQGHNSFHIPYHLAEKRSFIFVPHEESIVLLKRYLKKIKPDMVHFCLGISPLDFVIPSVCHDFKIPLVGIWHADYNSGPDVYSIFSKSIFIPYIPICRQLDSLVLLSSKMKEFVLRHGLDEKRVTVIPNGVDTKIYAPGISKFRKTHHIGYGIIFLGRLTMVKNPEMLIESFLKLDLPPQTKLVLVGTGEQEEYLRNEYQDPRIVFTGLINDEKTKVDILRSAEIFVLPSSFEGMSLALLEAMSTGLACVATGVGSHEELLKGAGICISPTKIRQELPFALKILYENPILQKSLSKKARLKILKNFQEEKQLSCFLDLYQETIADYQKRGCPQTKPLEINIDFRKKAESLWQKAKKLGAYYLFGED